MIKKTLLLLIILPISVFSQENKFSKFELMYNVNQQITENDDWPKYGLEAIQLYNDTLFTILVNNNHLTCLPLSETKKEEIKHKKLNLPKKCIPNNIIREKNRWYFITFRNGVGFLADNGEYVSLINKNIVRSFQNIFIIDNRILLFDSNGYKGLFSLYDLKGNLLNSTNLDTYSFMYPSIYNNKIIDGYIELTVNKDTIKVSDIYDHKKYGKEDLFVGGCKSFGYFINWDSRDHLVIRDMDNKMTTEQFIIPVKFKDTDLGIPEEDSINLRVFSEDNNTFYFVTLKHGHLLIYKAVR